MTDSFNVMTEPWIPVRESNGGLTFVGLRDAVARANELSEISDGSPIIEYGLYRLLITLLMDVYRPLDIDELEDLLDDGAFDQSQFEAYVRQCMDEGVSFDLFDPTSPFLQTVYSPEWDKEPKPVGYLDYTRPRGNNHVHFDHRGARSQRITYAQAARLLPAAQLFGTAGLGGYRTGVNGVPPYFTIARGQTLFETLVLSMVPTDSIESFDEVPPMWRTDADVEPGRVVLHTSWLFGMLFPARRIHLIPCDGEVREVYYGPGLNFKGTELWDDPHVAYHPSKKGRSAWTPHTGMHPIWLNLVQLLRTKERPRIVGTVHRMDRRYVDLQLYGVETNQAQYVDSMRHDIRLPLELANDEHALAVLAEAFGDAKELANALFASLAIPDKPWTDGAGTRGSTPLPSARSAVSEYYRTSETDLWELLTMLGNAKDRKQRNASRVWWKERIIRNALMAYSAASETTRARTATLEQIFERKLILLGKIGRLRKSEKEDANKVKDGNEDDDKSE